MDESCLPWNQQQSVNKVHDPYKQVSPEMGLTAHVQCVLLARSNTDFPTRNQLQTRD